MFPEEERIRQDKLTTSIYKLSEKSLDENENIAVIKEMQMIYQNGFRHSYSEFFPILTLRSRFLKFLMSSRM